MANTYTLISSSTVGSGGAASVTFSSIPNTYTDLKIVYSTRISSSGNANAFFITFNSSTTGYNTRFIEGAGSGTPGSAYVTSRYGGLDTGNTATSNTFSNGEIYIPSYLSSNNKSYVADSISENNATLGVQWLVAALWSNTAAITSIKLEPDSVSNTYLQYSSFYLYGISNS